jgi:hypothetical protein
MKVSSVCTRVFFAIALFFVAIKGFYDIESNQGFVSQNLRLLSEKTEKFDISFNKYRRYSAFIVLIQNYLLLISTITLILSLNFGKYLVLISAIIDIVLIHNPYFYGQPKIKLLACEYLALFGGVLNCLK